MWTGSNRPNKKLNLHWKFKKKKGKLQLAPAIQFFFTFPPVGLMLLCYILFLFFPLQQIVYIMTILKPSPQTKKIVAILNSGVCSGSFTTFTYKGDAVWFSGTFELALFYSDSFSLILRHFNNCHCMYLIRRFQWHVAAIFELLLLIIWIATFFQAPCRHYIHTS